MRAYYFDNLPGDQRLPHESASQAAVSISTLNSIKVEFWNIPLQGHEEKLNAVAKERGYRNRDVITISKEGLGDEYETKLKAFYKEHIHEDEEIRYIMDGGGFFDVREAPTDEWIRIAVSAGDLLVLPAGIYHRFSVDERNMTRTTRLFKDEPKWSAIYRSDESDTNPHRIEYLNSITAAA
ncbi:Acireductone dioxygenase ARD family [Rhodocollybia butyracea]|uniref:Acireductone dioxygenase n=1 Tax=Rhodocollybia butyracea TaxID=206335 RepID=A0A9P5UCS6_9AGAR|nr:Acireductone dioxygenase ARD family [Rhodocollybia butyracea]